MRLRTVLRARPAALPEPLPLETMPFEPPPPPFEPPPCKAEYEGLVDCLLLDPVDGLRHDCTPQFLALMRCVKASTQ